MSILNNNLHQKHVNDDGTLKFLNQIAIRNLKEEHTVLLHTLREEFQTPNNSQALLIAAKKYFQLKRQLERQKERTNEVQQLNTELLDQTKQLLAAETKVQILRGNIDTITKSL